MRSFALQRHMRRHDIRPVKCLASMCGMPKYGLHQECCSAYNAGNCCANCITSSSRSSRKRAFTLQEHALMTSTTGRYIWPVIPDDHQ